MNGCPECRPHRVSTADLQRAICDVQSEISWPEGKVLGPLACDEPQAAVGLNETSRQLSSRQASLWCLIMLGKEQCNLLG